MASRHNPANPANSTHNHHHHQEAGGFLPPGQHPSGLLSPPRSSSLASNGPNSAIGTVLPTPRQHALKAGSPKETAFIHYVDRGVLEVGRRVALRGGVGVGGGVEEGEDGDGVEREGGHRDAGGVKAGVMSGAGKGEDGYTGFAEVGRDLERLVEVVWVSGTPSLQIPYLLSLALLTTTYIPAFPPAPRSLFRLLDKLDSAFASLLQGSDIHTGEPLPGFEGNRRRGVNGTEKVRIKSLVERTRVVVVEVFMGSAEFEGEDEGTGGDTATEMESESEVDAMDGVERDWSAGRDWEMDVARVYVRTLEELGDELVGPSIGIPEF